MANTDYAKINEDGTIAYGDPAGSIDNVVHTPGSGRYQVNFRKSLNSTPVVVATVMTETMDCNLDGANCSISITDVQPDHVCFAIRAASDCHTMVDCPFNFVVLTPTKPPKD